MPDRLSLSQARRLALGAQGLAGARPRAAVRRGQVQRTVDRVAPVQIDSVNVLVRSHYLPLYSRLGPYQMGLLDDEAYRHRRLFEYWAHEASLVPMELHPLLRWRMARADQTAWGRMRRLASERPGFVEDVLAQVAERGPLGAGELMGGGRGRGPWWGWAEGKIALEWLFWSGQVAVADRAGFQRRYDLTERVIPPEVLALPTPPLEEAQRALLARAGRALGVATLADLADYFRIRVPEARPRVAELVEDGTLVPAQVQGWDQPAYRHPGVALPRRAEAATLLSPFDSLVWARPRTQRLFGFHLRLELYVPEPKRVHGYYVLPFLLGQDLVARLDLKADRPRSTLLVRAAFGEQGAVPATVCEPLAVELGRLAGWLGLSQVEVEDRGDLASALAAALDSGVGGLDYGAR